MEHLVPDHVRKAKSRMADALEFFDRLQKVIAIKYYDKINTSDGFKIKFTYHSSFNGWSHKQTILVNEDGVFLNTYRTDRRPELDKYEVVSTYAHNQVAYNIPISDEKEIIHYLTKIDRFSFNYE